jgi:hypothetical protein
VYLQEQREKSCCNGGVNRERNKEKKRGRRKKEERERRWPEKWERRIRSTVMMVWWLGSSSSN